MDLPIANCEPEPERLRHDLFDRLRWDIFGSLEAIQVKENDILAPFLGHHIASEQLADPPITNLTVYIGCCSEKAALDESDEEYRYPQPEPIVIEDKDGISLKDFVTRVHEYLQANRDEIYKCEDEMYAFPVDLGDGLKAVDVIPNEDNRVFGEGEGEEEEDEEPTGINYFYRSGNIPEGSRFFFDGGMFGEIDEDEYSISVDVFVEGNMGISLETFWERKEGVMNADGPTPVPTLPASWSLEDSPHYHYV